MINGEYRGPHTFIRGNYVTDLHEELTGQAEMAVHMLNLAVRSVKFLGVEFDQSEYEEVSVLDTTHL